MPTNSRSRRRSKAMINRRLAKERPFYSQLLDGSSDESRHDHDDGDGEQHLGKDIAMPGHRNDRRAGADIPLGCRQASPRRRIQKKSATATDVIAA